MRFILPAIAAAFVFGLAGCKTCDKCGEKSCACPSACKCPHCGKSGDACTCPKKAECPKCHMPADKCKCPK